MQSGPIVEMDLKAMGMYHQLATTFNQSSPSRLNLLCPHRLGNTFDWHQKKSRVFTDIDASFFLLSVDDLEWP